MKKKLCLNKHNLHRVPQKVNPEMLRRKYTPKMLRNKLFIFKRNATKLG